MKIRTKMIVAFVTVILTPILLIFFSLLLMNQFQLRSFRERYGVEDTGSLLSYNTMDLFSNLTSTMRDQLEAIVEEDAARLEDTDYLEELNEELSGRQSYMIVMKDAEVYYVGQEDFPEEMLQYLPRCGQQDVYEDSGYYLGGDFQCLITQQSFSFQDGSEGNLYLVTEIRFIFPEIKSILLDVGILIILVLVITAILLTSWLYSSFLKPLKVLQSATKSIQEGNLDFSLEVTGKDEISELCRDFEGMRGRLKESAEDKIQYDRENKILISNISHDLKTPLTAVKGYCEGILDGVASSPEKLEKYVRTIYNKANDMEKLIDELTLYSKIDTNRIPYNYTKIRVKDYFGDCADELALELESQNVELTYSNYLEDDVIIIGDTEQLKRVVNNIISNSIKYMDKKKGFINLRIRDEGDFIRVEIEDNGKGIAAKDIPYIFDRFYRTDSSRNSATGGSGIGLSIVKKIIEDHGGRIWATSKEGTGTIMHFALRKYQEVPYE
ncbi:MAG: HAMP domain-containing histidine kinase [Lachnospiraceae bacterium]|nr:HAMP domain-containing histidine kinase [Lachnospiraceae bacterium]